ncbi:MAG: AbrB-like transcriptional regulator, partial [Prochlorococcus sp.]
TTMLDLKPGDNFQIKLGKKAIRLVPEGDTEEGGED